VNQQAETDEVTLNQSHLEIRQAKWDAERAVVLRVYNYFRIVLSFFLIIIFYEIPNQTFVGILEPRWFQTVVLVYLMLNVSTGFLILVSNDKRLTGLASAASIVVLDIFFLSMLIFTSGGVGSGLGYLLVFSISFGSVMLAGQTTWVFPALATVNSISTELYLHNTGAVEDSQHLFQVAMLGTSFFIVTFFFHYVSTRIKSRETEVVSLEAMDELHKIAEESRQELEISNSRFTVLLTSTGEGVLGLDMKGTVTFANPRACHLLDIEYEDLISSDIQRFMIVQGEADDEKIVSFRQQKILELLSIEPKFTYDPGNWQTAKNESFIIDYSCEATVNKSDERTGAVLLFQNVTTQRENEERIKYLSSFDDLTGLANRTNFQEVVKSAISRTQRTDRSMAILIIDTDHFAVINEKYGHEAGDEMLKVVARRLEDSLREGDIVARLHADQFAVMLVDLDHAENAAIVADNMTRSIAEPIPTSEGDVDTSVSIGIAVLQDKNSNANDLISSAVSALDVAKHEGRNTYRFFQPELQQKAEEKKRVQMLLRSAAENDEFQMLYQPIISLREEKIHSSEALIRWFPEGSDPIRPDIFIPIAEESGQITNIGSWVLGSVSQQVKQWKQDLDIYPTVAINVSSKQLRDSTFREQFLETLKTYEIPVDAVELELTETGVMEDPETCLDELVKLHDNGVSISIDDFGTGYSSLDYLRRLPLDILKIDQSFTFGIGESENDEEIVKVMIRMAHAMGLQVICEGVETREQLDFLSEHNCDLVQGYYFSEPRSVKDITNLFVGERDGSINIMEGAAG
jgi:diguanylate cyclase (GGDEF)-like protein